MLKWRSGLISATALISAWAKENPLEISAKVESEKAIIRIKGVIWEYNNSSRWFTREIDKIIGQGITDVMVYINSPGGDVFQANDIANEIDKFSGEIEGEGGAIVGSAASYIAVRIKNFALPENGQFMYHKPTGNFKGNEDSIESELKLLKNITANYRKTYSEKTGLSEDEIEKRWAKGDVWLSANEAKNQKFVSKVIPSADITAQDSKMIAACGAPNQYEATSKPESKPNQEQLNNQNSAMEHLKLMAVKLGLPENASQKEIDAKIQAMQSDANKLEQLEKTNEDQEKDRKAKAIKAMFDKAIKEKRITATQAENMQSWAETDLKACQDYIDGIKALEKPEVSASHDGTKKFEDYSDEELAELEESDPAKFTALYDQYLDQ